MGKAKFEPGMNQIGCNTKKALPIGEWDPTQKQYRYSPPVLPARKGCFAKGKLHRPLNEVKAIIIHQSGKPGLTQTCGILNKKTLETRKDGSVVEYTKGTHFCVTPGGLITQHCHLNRTTNHAGGDYKGISVGIDLLTGFGWHKKGGRRTYDNYFKNPQNTKYQKAMKKLLTRLGADHPLQLVYTPNPKYSMTIATSAAMEALYQLCVWIIEDASMENKKKYKAPKQKCKIPWAFPNCIHGIFFQPHGTGAPAASKAGGLLGAKKVKWGNKKKGIAKYIGIVPHAWLSSNRSDGYRGALYVYLRHNGASPATAYAKMLIICHVASIARDRTVPINIKTIFETKNLNAAFNKLIAYKPAGLKWPGFGEVGSPISPVFWGLP